TLRALLLPRSAAGHLSSSRTRLAGQREATSPRSTMRRNATRRNHHARTAPGEEAAEAGRGLGTQPGDPPGPDGVEGPGSGPGRGSGRGRAQRHSLHVHALSIHSREPAPAGAAAMILAGDTSMQLQPTPLPVPCGLIQRRWLEAEFDPAKCRTELEAII